MNIRRVARELLPPVAVRMGKRLLGRVDPPNAPVEPVMASFSSLAVGSYSQYGEDLVIDSVLGGIQRGFYVDIGANDPIELNNTKRFSLRGWTGINVEPNPAVFARIVVDRPNDTNLNLGIGSSDEALTFYSIDPDTLSTFDEATAQLNLQQFGEARIVESVEVQVVTLSSLLRRHLPDDQRIDFLSMDVEGGELEVLRGNDWTMHRPRSLMIEVFWSGQQIVDFLSGVGYEMVWCNGTNALFLDKHDEGVMDGGLAVAPG